MLVVSNTSIILNLTNVWQFGVLHRSSKQIEQGLNLYRVTEDIEAVVRILLAALMQCDRTALITN